MPISIPPPYTGSCPCSLTTYTITATPLIINACHCTDCQSETGTAFATNLIVESAHLTLSSTSPALLMHSIPSFSGTGQTFVRCSKCYFTLWSHYGSPALSMVRVGTLEEGVKKALKPDAQIFVRSKVDWVRLDEGIVGFEGYYDEEKVWGAEAVKRRRAYLGEVKRWEEERTAREGAERRGG